MIWWSLGYLSMSITTWVATTWLDALEPRLAPMGFASRVLVAVMWPISIPCFGFVLLCTLHRNRWKDWESRQ